MENHVKLPQIKYRQGLKSMEGFISAQIEKNDHSVVIFAHLWAKIMEEKTGDNIPLDDKIIKKCLALAKRKSSEEITEYMQKSAEILLDQIWEQGAAIYNWRMEQNSKKFALA
ncbi:MAG: hypothetical protein PHS95_00595 [Candidatus Pacebacteria bacterium]|nr:hypothetical protein [Candidatus Paceibacterota bacterium]